MKLEYLVATMNRADASFVSELNLSADALVINQTDEKIDEISQSINGYGVRMLSFNEKGLSKSRNRAINNASADICVISDECMCYNNDSTELILNAYKEHPECDVIAFTVSRNAPGREKKNDAKPKKINRFNYTKIISVETTFRLSAIKQNGIKFNELFGTGSGKYSCGEENLFLLSCLRKGLKIYYMPVCIADVKQHKSTWFSGWSEKVFFDKGAQFYEMYKGLFPLFMLLFAVRKYPRYKNNLSFKAAVSALLNGKNDYLQTVKKGKK